ncbi:MAG TPA: TldD/PmbA family protein [Cyclobacteriaceae bacterium]
MALLSKEDARKILDKAISFSKADGISVSLNGAERGNIRYARNSVTTSGEDSNLSLGVSSYFGKKAGTATINEFDDASIEKCVRRAEELAKLAPENPEFVDPLGPQAYGPESKTFSEATAKITPEYRAQAAADSINPAIPKNVTAAGYLQDSRGFAAIANNKGLYAYNKSTSVDFTVTMRTNDGTGSGWAAQNLNDVSKLNAGETSKIAIDKALMSREAKAIEPGKYTVILEPAAGADLLRLMLNMNARTADEGRSFLSKKGGGTKLGEKLVDERVNIYSDPWNEIAPASPWSGDGLPRQKMDLIRNGVVSNLFYDRYWASQKNVAPVPFPGNAIMEGGNASFEDMIKDTKRGVLVTRFWYIRPVDPQTLLFTGLTRDGTFFIENGKIKHPIKNFRFNESPIIMLNNLETLGKQVRAVTSEGGGPGGGQNLLVPYIKIRDFTFTSLSDAV